ncbi:MAG: quinone-dependent dihydroorotate dehydrogenase [Cyanobacteria bacterium P01_E01_bin.34]
MYSHTLRPLLFRIDPEWLHRWAIAQSRWLALNPYLHPLLSGLAAPRDSRLQQVVLGLTFQHPVGLAAGFDKSAEAIALWPRIGFAFSEVGTITARAQPGNPLPRLFRLPADEAVINRYGFNNQGANAVAQRLTTDPRSPAGFPVGLNLGKSKVTPLGDAPSDYLNSFQQLYPYGDYFVVNVSSPNTPGLRKLQSRENLERIVLLLQDHNSEHKPLLVKIAPDLTWEQLDELLEFVLSADIAGIIATNTTLQRGGLITREIAQTGRPPSEESGGLSGPPVRAKSTEMVRYIYTHTDGKLPIIGVGGIDSAEAAWEKIAAGASLVQLYTGLVYKGPGLPSQIVRGLISKLEEYGFSTISEAVGCDCK